MSDEKRSTTFDLAGKRVWVAGHRGLVGSALVRRLSSEGCELLAATGPSRPVDLRHRALVEDWLAAARPHAIFVAAGTVGGIVANETRPAEFLYDNLMIAANVIEGARRVGVEKLMFLGSSCIYPRLARQPIVEAELLGGPLEPTNQWYAVAKIAGIKLCQAYRRQHGCDFIAAMPTNLYGPGDNFDMRSGHVIPALMARIHAAKVAGRDSVRVWGTGRPRREFLYVDDLADACVHLFKCYSGEQHVNVGTGADVSIADLAGEIGSVIGYRGRFVFDSSLPDGTPRKLLDVSLLTSLGWRAQVRLGMGLARMYRWFCEHVANGRTRSATNRASDLCRPS